MSTSVATADVNGTARTTAKPPKRMLTTETATRVTSGDGPAGSHDVGIDDVALERADDDEHEQGERGHVEGLRKADRDDEDGADERADHEDDLDEADEPPASSQ
jgi:hypothetical protein